MILTTYVKVKLIGAMSVNVNNYRIHEKWI